jgi:hypothetical protein
MRMRMRVSGEKRRRSNKKCNTKAITSFSTVVTATVVVGYD